MTTIEILNNVKTVDDLEALNIGSIDVDITHRGGHLRFYNSDVAEFFNVPQELLPNKIGAYCNYLGGGVRGAITISTFSKDLDAEKASLITALSEACKRAYVNIEEEQGLLDDEDEDGEINWDNVATKKARDANMTSSYD